MWIDRLLLFFILVAGILWIIILNGFYRGGIKRLDPKSNVALITWLGVVLPAVALIVYLIRQY
jgi:hypothetical protein